MGNGDTAKANAPLRRAVLRCTPLQLAALVNDDEHDMHGDILVKRNRDGEVSCPVLGG